MVIENHSKWCRRRVQGLDIYIVPLWAEKLNGVYFSAETFYTWKYRFESAKTFHWVLSPCEVTSASTTRNKTRLEKKKNCFLGNYFSWNLMSFYFLKMLKPLSKIPLLVVKCNPRDSIYTIIFLFVGKVGCQQTEHWFWFLCVQTTVWNGAEQKSLFPLYAARQKLLCDLNTRYWRTADRNKWIRFSVTRI